MLAELEGERAVAACLTQGVRPPGVDGRTGDVAASHQTTESEQLPHDPPIDDEQVKGFVAGGVGGAVVGAIVAGPIGAVVGGAIGATSGAAVGVGAEAVDEKSKHDEVVAEHEARSP
jgi:uncharacterized protein YcfJ